MSQDQLLTVKEVAERFGLPAYSIYELTNAGTLPHLRIGRRIRFRPESLEAWLENQEQGGTD